MCGIWAYISKKNTFKNYYRNHFDKISHRGPDASIIIRSIIKDVDIGFHRLAIIE